MREADKFTQQCDREATSRRRKRDVVFPFAILEYTGTGVEHHAHEPTDWRGNGFEGYLEYFGWVIVEDG